MCVVFFLLLCTEIHTIHRSHSFAIHISLHISCLFPHILLWTDHFSDVKLGMSFIWLIYSSSSALISQISEELSELTVFEYLASNYSHWLTYFWPTDLRLWRCSKRVWVGCLVYMGQCIFAPSWGSDSHIHCGLKVEHWTPWERVQFGPWGGGIKPYFEGAHVWGEWSLLGLHPPPLALFMRCHVFLLQYPGQGTWVSLGGFSGGLRGH